MTTGVSRGLVGGLLVLYSCVAVQGSAAISATLFDDLNAVAVAAWRQLIGGLVLVAVLRPKIHGRSARDWGWIILLGAAMATMNVAFYSAVDLLPLGVAATLLYLGPFAVASVGFRSGRLLMLPACALLGVIMISRPTSVDSSTGLIVGLTAGCALAVYTLTSRQLGRNGGADTLALSVGSSAVLLSPFSLTSASGIQGDHVWILLASGAIGVASAFWCDFTALRLVGSRAVSVLFALDPVVGAVAGALLLSQTLDPVTFAGVAMVIVSGAVAASLRGRAVRATSATSA